MQTGANLNPNISFALLLLGKLGPVRFVLYCIAQFIGAIAAAGLVHGLIPGEFASRCSLSPGVSKVQGVFIEAFITAALVSSVLFLAVETRSLTDLAPVGIGLTLFAGHLVAAALTCVFRTGRSSGADTFCSGAGTNTARAFAPDVIAGFNTEQWIYWIGPTIGAVVAAAFYKLFTSARYPALRSNEVRLPPPFESTGRADLHEQGQPLIAPVLPKGTDRESSPEISHPGKAEEV